MSREEAIEAVVELLLLNGMGHFSATVLAGQIVREIGWSR